MQLMRNARAKSRGYAVYWEWETNRKLAEMNAACVLRDYLVLSGEPMTGQLSAVVNDPPDILLTSATGGRLGIEVTELIDSEAAKRHRYRKECGKKIDYDWAEWTRARITEELDLRIGVKDRKLAKVFDDFNEIILAVVTDEPMISDTLAREAVLKCRRSAKFISRAYLVLSYQPEAELSIYPDGCPILKIF